eukprot:gnl/TRDRNA2_/TRDRNA2_41556_c0_seq1.p1 gnl/TRDRNA2_/TRDRNA2_41556_c0~~gnl/TRDRNA2_/TRDRNA2_41556_c0_seq1.p1  ORF type:complete len:383 (-),score=64.98 gnl/TRDRNA2_/TRDRNA2_41556_c0_seq1:169-1317(-)
MQRRAPSLRLAGRQTAEAVSSPSKGQAAAPGRNSMGLCQTHPQDAASPQASATPNYAAASKTMMPQTGSTAAASASTDGSGRPMGVERKTKPPKRLEGGGFTIVDIMSSIPTARLDPFLIWHELPRHFYKPGEMPGAPLHPHRGFSECPYAKEMVGKDGPSALDVFKGRDHEGNKHEMKSGDFEFGQVGQGFEHEGLIDPRWTGYLHFFQLWINLPRAHKMDPPKIINCAAATVPVAEISSKPLAKVKVLLGENVFGCTSPVKSQHVPAQYLDFELAAGAQVVYRPPPEMQTRLAYMYRGKATVGGTTCASGEFLLLGAGDQLEVTAAGEDVGLLFLAGRKIGEPVVQHGPFVMTSKEEIQKCFQDYQRGQLCGRMTREIIK